MAATGCLPLTIQYWHFATSRSRWPSPMLHKSMLMMGHETEQSLMRLYILWLTVNISQTATLTIPERFREVKMPLAKDLLHPLHHEEKRKHKLKRLVQHPHSYFMDVKCPGCYRLTQHELITLTTKNHKQIFNRPTGHKIHGLRLPESLSLNSHPINSHDHHRVEPFE